jgi:hypothetical protein
LGLLKNETKNVWRFIPDDRQYILGYLFEENCQTTLPFMNESAYESCFHGQEEYSTSGLIPFTRKYPNIADYLQEQNSKRDAFLYEKEKENPKFKYL